MKEDNIEAFAIDLFKDLGFKYIHAPDVAPGSDYPYVQALKMCC